ncbi:membrane metallo-endopeptidase-like 1 [Ornithodoros turicata]|uniref:membrane metallo-endopeptidase-like 1 n=1 Tax=Ornithodoros turicata TaxID=34597 RepID=UPI003139B7F7
MPSAGTSMVQNPDGPVVEFAWSTLSAALSWIGATVLGVTAGTIVVTSLAYFKGHYNDVQRKNSSERLHVQPCYTKSCQHAAEALATTLSFNVNPCHDFFAFVCDRYNEHIPDAFTGGRNSILSYAIALLFVPPAAEGRQLSAIEKAATLFRSCMRLFSSDNQDSRYVLSNMMDDMHVSLDLPPPTFDPFEYAWEWSTTSPSSYPSPLETTSTGERVEPCRYRTAAESWSGTPRGRRIADRHGMYITSATRRTSKARTTRRR